MLKVKGQSSQAIPKKYYTPEEYLALEEKAEYRSEYYKGKISAMPLNSMNHNSLVSNISARMHFAFKTTKECFVFMVDLRLWVEAEELFTYPDIQVVCGKREFYKNRKDTITNSVLIIEVLSESTEDYDRGKKFEFYQAIPTLREYILIDQYKFHVEQFSLVADGKWVLTEYKNADDILRCSSVDFQIPLREIYDQVEFENE